jgi:acetyltransferase-like isoleucine patch superfamily enzyme
MRRLLLWPLACVSLRFAGVEVGPGWRLYGRPTILRFRGSRIAIGRGFENRNWFASNAIGVAHPTLLATLARGASIRIGDDVGVSGGVIAARREIEIGDRTLIGANALLVDNDFHPREPGVRRYGRDEIPASPVRIGQDVFIGTRTIILKGTTIGDRCVIGAGSVVAGTFPADSLIAGAPATVVRSLGENQVREES